MQTIDCLSPILYQAVSQSIPPNHEYVAIMTGSLFFKFRHLRYVIGAIHAHCYLKIASRTETRIQLCAKLMNNVMHYFLEILSVAPFTNMV